MKPTQAKRFAIMESPSRPLKVVALMIAALFCYHVAIVLADQQQQQRQSPDSVADLADTPPLKDPATQTTVVSLSGVRQRLAREQPMPTSMSMSLEEPRNFLVMPQYAAVRYNYRADIDQDGSYRPAPEVDLVELAKLENLLEAMSIRLAQPQPAASQQQQQQQQQEQIHRTGRTYLFGGNTAADRQPQPQPQQQDVAYFNNRYSAAPRRLQPAPLQLGAREQQQLQTLQGLYPQVGRTMAGGPLSLARANGRSRTRISPHHTSDTAEVVIHTPLHSTRSVSDYEWKRVENSRWNNLRGMWGKRSVPAANNNQQQQDDELLSEANNEPKQQQQQQQKRSIVSGADLM